MHLMALRCFLTDLELRGKRDMALSVLMHLMALGAF